jgi:hypothetical protein
LLAILEQNPGTTWTEFLARVEVQSESNPDLAPLPEDAEDDERGAESAPPSATTGNTVPPPPPTSTGDDVLAQFKL